MKKLVEYSFLLKFLPILTLLLCLGRIDAQENKEQIRLERESQELLSEANESLSEENFVDAEADYRKSIAILPSDEIGKYNLGNAYYNKEKNDEAKRRFAQAAGISKTKPEKHRAYHNLGNTLMNEKNYQGAVEAYKNALRNNPTDDETRYNFALAKDLLEKNPPQGGDGDDEKEDQKKNEDQNKDNQEDNKDDGKEKEGEDGDKKEEDGEGDDKKEKNKGENDEKEGKPDEPKDKKDGEGEQPKQQKNKPVPGQLSPQQVKNLLEAMNNEEKKVQDKINAQKQKGAKVKPNKDW